MLCCCFHIYDFFFVTLLYCSQAKYFLYKWVTETLVRKSVSEISDFPNYGMQMIANYFYRVMMSLLVCVVFTCSVVSVLTQFFNCSEIFLFSLLTA